MSNTLAVGAVTATLARILSRVKDPLPGDPAAGDPLTDAEITTKPLDKARDQRDDHNQINVFLYQVQHNAALRNLPLPNTSRAGEIASSPVALDLHYLLTCYGKDGDDVQAHRLLGRAMTLLHDNAVLAPSDIEAALPGTDLAAQIERVRVSPLGMSTEEMSRLWTTFQIQYRVSVAYQLSVVLIDSTRAVKAALPVLARGVGDRGPVIAPTVVPPVPTLETLVIPAGRPSARFGVGAAAGDLLALRGHDLAGDEVSVELDNARLAEPVHLTPSTATATEVTAALPGDTAGWPAGIYAVALRIRRGAREMTTRALPFSIAPRIVDVSPANPVHRLAGDVALKVTSSPALRHEQRIALLVGDREVRPQPFTGSVSAADFVVVAPEAGTYPVRLRVDGVDSLLIADYTATPPAFDPAQRVVIV